MPYVDHYLRLTYDPGQDDAIFIVRVNICCDGAAVPQQGL